jgi:hypothetical protein
MSTYTVTTQPIEVAQGNKGVLSLVNNGPNTIYLDSIPGVSPLNGFVLPPTGQMTWDGKAQLWAATASGSSKLVTVDAGNLSITSRGSFWMLLDSAQRTFGGTASLTSSVIETGFCKTLLVELSQINGLVNNNAGSLVAQWQDDLGNVIVTETYLFNWLQAVTPTFITVPVKGTHVVLTAFAGSVFNAGNPFLTGLITYGTDIELPWSSYTDQIAMNGNADGTLYPRPNGGMLSQFTSVVAGSFYTLPQLGNHLVVSLRTEGAVTVAGDMFIVPNISGGIVFGTVHIPVLGTSAFYSITVDLPLGVCPAILLSPGPTTASKMDLVWTYTNS